MKRRLIASYLFAFVAILLVAWPVLAAVYSATYTITESNGTSYTMLPIVKAAPNQFLADNGFMKASALDTRIKTLGGLTKPHLVTDNMTLVATAVTANSQTNLFFSTGNSDLTSMPIITGLGGYITTADNATLEPSSNFTMTWDGYINTDNGTAKNLVSKADAITVSVNATTAQRIDAVISPLVTVNQTTQDGDAALSSDGNTKVGERYNNFPAGARVIQVSFYLKKTNSPTGTANITMRKVSDDSLIGTLGSIDVSTLTTSYVWHDFTTAVTNSVAQDVRFLFEYNTSASPNTVSLGISSTDTLAGAVRTANNGSWTDAATSDASIKIYTPNAAAFATGVTSGEHTVIAASDNTTLRVGIDTTADAMFPVKTGLVIDAPLWHSDLKGSTFTDKSSNYTSLTVTGANWTAQGRIFDGVDDVITTGKTIQQFGVSNAVTIIAWAKPSVATTADSIVACTTAGGANILDLVMQSNTFKFAGLCTVGSIAITGAATDTNWHFLAGTYGGNNNASLYVDLNTPVVDTSCSGNIANSGTLTIGDSGDFAAIEWNFGGIIGDVLIYNRVLSQAEITANYNATKWKYDGVGNPAVVESVSVPNNSNAWTFLQNDVMRYANSIVETVGGAEVLRYQPNSMIIGTVLPDRTGTAQNGVITWGANPAGIGVVMGSLVSASQPVPGTTTTTPTTDLLPAAGATNMNTPPDVSGALLTNPLRPFVVIMSDTTSLTERQAWIWLGIAFVLLVTVAVAKAVRGHHVITGVAAAAAILACVVMTIFPLYALIGMAVAIIAGITMERSPSL